MNSGRCRDLTKRSRHQDHLPYGAIEAQSSSVPRWLLARPLETSPKLGPARPETSAPTKPEGSCVASKLVRIAAQLADGGGDAPADPDITAAAPKMIPTTTKRFTRFRLRSPVRAPRSTVA